MLNQGSRVNRGYSSDPTPRHGKYLGGCGTHSQMNHAKIALDFAGVSTKKHLVCYRAPRSENRTLV